MSRKVYKKKPAGKKGHWVTVKVPGTTNNKQQAVINFLLSEGHSASRVNVQGQWDENLYGEGKGGWRPSGSRLGFFDVVACLKTRWGFGLYLAWDQKTGTDELRPDQEEYMDEVRKAGGVAESGDGIEDFMLIYEKLKHLIL